MTAIFRLPVAVALAAVLLAGCQTAKVANPVTKELAGNDPEVQLNFWHTLATRPVCSNDEAFHGLLLFIDGADNCTSYDQRVQTLKERQMLPGRFGGTAEQAVQRGTLAVAVCRILQIKGGMMMRLTGAASRYALRELEFEEVFPPSSAQQTFSGNEFLGIIGRMEDRQRADTAEVSAAAMPGEMQAGASRPPATQRR